MKHDINTKMSKVQRGSRTRPLGSIRVTNSIEAVPKFPPLQTTTPRADRISGVHGNAMAVPPQRTPSESVVKADEKPAPVKVSTSPGKRTIASSKSDTPSARSTEDNASVLEKTRSELKESMVRERELKQQIMQLHKDIDALKQQIMDKEKIIQDLHDQFVRQEEKYKEMYEKEQSRHNETKHELKAASTELLERKQELLKAKKEHQIQVDDMKRKHDVTVSQLQADKAREISIRDEKLNKLKKQMADALQGNSWERQQQLDELSKELSKVQEEADLLRMRLKASNKSGSKGGGGSSSGCSNCDALGTQLTHAQKHAKEQDSRISELTAKCKKYEKPNPKLDSLQKQSSRGKIK